MAAAQGETSLSTLLATLRATLHPSTYVFITFLPPAPLPETLYKQLLFREAEGITIISTLDSAKEHNIANYAFPCRMITCEVHSSLEAVGFMAVIASRLAEMGMGANPVSGFFHDHLFVPVGREEEAMECLEELAKENRETVKPKE